MVYKIITGILILISISLSAQPVIDETHQIFERTITLKWEGGDPDGDIVTYDIYFGTDSLSIPLIADNVSDTYYVVANVDYDTKYFWKVIPKDEHGLQTEGEVWNFTTEMHP